ncbi:unnamed protein product [Ectocarpus fasciculatus]
MSDERVAAAKSPGAAAPAFAEDFGAAEGTRVPPPFSLQSLPLVPPRSTARLLTGAAGCAGSCRRCTGAGSCRRRTGRGGTNSIDAGGAISRTNKIVAKSSHERHAELCPRERENQGVAAISFRKED